jgi:methyl-accepting chemotaxis protein
LRGTGEIAETFSRLERLASELQALVARFRVA